MAPNPDPSNPTARAQKVTPSPSSLKALTQSQIQELQTLAARLREDPADDASPARTLAIFTGPNTAAKLAAAHIIAGDLQRDLYRADPAAIANHAAAPAVTATAIPIRFPTPPGSILFFDEADAISRKRTNVQDSHDRYANLATRQPDDTSPVQQILSQHPGVAILSVGSMQDCDPALLAQPHITLDFPLAP